MEILIASRNLGKIREIREILSVVPALDVNSLLAYPEYRPPEESGTTFEENAQIKALHAARELNSLVLADDSGLVVPTLDGAPGVFSRRYAGEEATDRENRLKLLDALDDKKGMSRQAYFECVLVLADPSGVLKQSVGRCEGSITAEERGRHGFGYDSVFMKHDYDKTFAEISESVKNRVSHRRKALDSLLAFLESRAQKVQG